MPDLSITPSNVLHTDGEEIEVKQCDVACNAGQAVFVTDNDTFDLAEVSTEEKAAVQGVMVNSAAAGQLGIAQFTGEVTLGAGTQGQVVYASSTAGGINTTPPTSGQFSTVIGLIKANGILEIGIVISGESIP